MHTEGVYIIRVRIKDYAPLSTVFIKDYVPLSPFLYKEGRSPAQKASWKRDLDPLYPLLFYLYH